MGEFKLSEMYNVLANGKSEDLIAFLNLACVDFDRGAVEAVSRAICGSSDLSVPFLFAKREDQIFFDSIAMRLKLWASGDRNASFCSTIEIDEGLDFLAHTCNPRTMSAMQMLCLAVNLRCQRKEVVAIVATVRDEGVYLPEWIAHHRLLGIEKFFIYTNNNCDGSDGLLDSLAKHGYITLIRNKFALGVNFQRKVYQHAIFLLQELQDYQWALVIDVDEFLNFREKECGNIAQFLRRANDHLAENKPDAVIFPWNWRFTDRQFIRDQVDVLDYYRNAIIQRNVKSLFRLNRTLGMCEVHIPTQDEKSCFVDGEFRVIPESGKWKGVERPYTGGVIEHYWGKSFVEFVRKKQRGEDLQLGGLFNRQFTDFFQWTGTLSHENLCPISAKWIDLVKLEKEKILEIPEIRHQYGVVLATYKDFVEKSCRNNELRSTYDHLFEATEPSMR